MATDIPWTPVEVLEKLLTDAITQVRSYEQPPSILAHTIMVVIETEVARSREEVVMSVSKAIRGPK